LMDRPQLIDRSLLAARRRRALAAAVPGADFLLAAACDDLADRLAAVSRLFEIGVDLGGHTGRTEAMLKASGKVGRTLRADLFAPDPHLPPPDVVIDDACPPFAPESLDLIVSALSLQFVNDLPGTLVQIRRSLRPDGLFLGSLLGGETLSELRAVLVEAELDLKGGAAPRVLPFADLRDLGGLMQRAGFALPVVDRDPLVVRYDSLFELMADLRAMGATSSLTERSRTPLSRSLLQRAAAL